jgi:hypothetical protein
VIEAADQLASDCHVDAGSCETAIRATLSAGAGLEHPQTGRPVFAFRLHQFLSKGDNVYVTIEPPDRRHVTSRYQAVSPESERGDPKILVPVAFCRECGQDYLVVRRTERDGVRRFEAGTLVAPPSPPGATTPPGGTGTPGATAPGGPGATTTPTAPVSPSPVASPSPTLAPSPSASAPVSAGHTWSDHVEVTIAGFDAAQTGELLALSAERMDAAPSIPAAVERIRRRAGQVVQSLDHLDAADPFTGRVNDIAADAWMPHVLLINNPSPQDIAALEALDNDLADTGRCAVAIAVTTSTPIGRWPVTVDAEGNMSIGFLGMSDQEAIPAARLPRAELTNLADLLNTARRGTAAAERTGQPDRGPEVEWPPVPPAPEPEPWATGTDAAGGLLTDEAEQWPDQADTLGHSEQANEEHDPTDDEAPDPHQTPADRRSPDALQPAANGTANEPALDQAGLPAGGDDAAQVPAVVALVGPRPARKRVTTPVRPRRHSDPTLDADLRAWTDADPDRPRIAILGPVTVEAPGQLPDERLRFYAEIIVYLATRGRRGATTDQFDDAIWPDQQVKANTRRVAVARARRWLGEAPDGQPWLPDATADRRYRLRDGFLLDWHLFRRLRSRGESRGPAGTNDLRDALSLVRGAPPRQRRRRVLTSRAQPLRVATHVRDPATPPGRRCGRHRAPPGGTLPRRRRHHRRPLGRRPSLARRPRTSQRHRLARPAARRGSRRQHRRTRPTPRRTDERPRCRSPRRPRPRHLPTPMRPHARTHASRRVSQTSSPSQRGCRRVRANRTATGTSQ